MASFSAQLYVAGHVFPVLRCAYHTSQATDGRGRAATKVHYHPVELVLDVPDSDVLLAWAADPHKRQAADVVFLDPATGSALETLHLAAAYCVGYRESFAAGDTSTGAYQCHLTLSDPDGFTLAPGGPSLAFLPGGSPLPSLTTAAEETALTQTAEAAAETVVEETAPVSLGVLARLLALLPEAGVAAALAVFIPTNSKNDPGYQSEWDMVRQHLPLTDKDRAELAVLEQRHADGTLTAGEEAHLLALLARVKGLHLQKLADLNTAKPDFVGQVPMEQSDLGRMALAFRQAKSEDGWHDGNVTVFEYTNNEGKRCHLVQETNPEVTRKHAERLALEKLQRQGIPSKNITRIYSELEPCETPDGGKQGDGCKAMLKKEVPGAKITYSYEYRGTGADTRASRVNSIERRAADFNKYKKR